MTGPSAINYIIKERTALKSERECEDTDPTADGIAPVNPTLAGIKARERNSCQLGSLNPNRRNN